MITKFEQSRQFLVAISRLPCSNRRSIAAINVVSLGTFLNLLKRGKAAKIRAPAMQRDE